MTNNQKSAGDAMSCQTLAERDGGSATGARRLAACGFATPAPRIYPEQVLDWSERRKPG